MKRDSPVRLTNFLLTSILAILIIAIAVLSCKKEYSCENCLPQNKKPPIANAGPDQAVTLPTDTVLLDGSSSMDPDGSIVYYHWAEISGPAPVSFNNADAVKAKASALNAGAYKFELTVRDNDGLTGKDTMNVLVKAAGVKLPPVADAGVDQIIVLPVDSVLLNGSGSIDPDGIIVTYAWTKISGPASFSIANSQLAQTRATNLVQGTYEFKLTVTDNDGLSSSDVLQVIVNASTTVTSCANRAVIPVQLQQIGTLSISGISLACASAGNKIAFAGGRRQSGNSTRVDILDVSTNTWSTAELTNQNREGVAAASVGNKIMFAGGMENDNGTLTSRVDIYNTTTNAWSTAELSQARAYLAAATVGNKVIFAGGGYWNTYFTGSTIVDIYDNATNTWSTASLSIGRSSLSATVIGNKVYIAGGSTGGTSSPPTTSSTRIDIYDALANTWSTAEMQEGRSGHAGIAVGGNLFLGSGIHAQTSSSLVMSNNVEIWNPLTGVSNFACMIPRYFFDAVSINNNIVFFTGIQDNPALANNQIEIYNTTTGSWSTGLLDQSITISGIISVNGNIYVAGGVSSVYDNSVQSNKVWKLVF